MARQWRSLLQALLSSTKSMMSGSGPHWTKVNAACHSAQSGISTCLASSRSIARTPDPRFSQDLAALRLPQLDVASFRSHLPSRRNVTTSITCLALLNLGSCLVTDNSCSRSTRRQLLRASKPMYALPATIPTEPVNTLISSTHLQGDPTLHFTHVAIGLDVVDEYPGSDGLFRHYISERHYGRTRDFSIGDREDRQMVIKTLLR